MRPTSDIYRKYIEDPPEDPPEHNPEPITAKPAVKKKLRAHERRVAAIKFRRQGYTYEAIGKALGVTAGRAHQLVTEAMKMQIRDEVGPYKDIQVDQLNYLLTRIWRQVEDGSLWAIDRALRIMERQAKLLGLDAPPLLATVINTTVNTGDTDGRTLQELKDADPAARDDFYRSLRTLLDQKEVQA